MLLSLVIPCYNEEGNVKRFYEATVAAFYGKGFDFEMIYVDDGSRDATFSEISELHGLDPRVRAISFSRNFGKEAAMYAGLGASRGELTVIIDADLQQRPEVVLEMMRVLDEDSELDCVAAYQQKRREGRAMSGIKRGFYKLINRISDVDFVNGASDFRLMRRGMVDAILSMSEYHRFSKGIFSFVGFNTKFIPYRAEEREVGKTKWGARKLAKYALDGIFSFSTAPLRISTFIGFLSSLASIIYLIAVIVQKLAFGIDVPGYATIVVLVLFLGGVQLFCLGIIGEYLAKMYVQVKDRPIYIVRRKLDTDTALSDKSAKEAEETSEGPSNVQGRSGMRGAR